MRWLFVFLLGCTGSSADLSKTLVVRLPGEPPSLDMVRGLENLSFDVLINLHEGLMGVDDQLRPVPNLAEDHFISKDGRTYTFKLRQAKWSDGALLTADQFVETWERLLNPKNACEYAYFFYDIEGAEDYNQGRLKDFSKVGVKALNARTLEVRLRQPASYFLVLTSVPTTFPQRLDIISKHGEKWTEGGVFPTLGPYRLTEWKHDRSLSAEINPHYYGPRPVIEKIQWLIVGEVATAINLFEAKKVDIIRRIPPNDIERFRSTPFYGEAPYLRGSYYGFNTKKAPFSDLRVRKAFAMSVDRDQIPKILKGGQSATTSWIPKGLLGFNPDIGLKFKPEEARKLLAQAGFPGGKGFPTTVMAFDIREDNQVIAEFLQQEWKKNLGINLEIRSSEWKVHLEQTRTDSSPLFRMGWGADFADPHNFMDLFLTKSGNNHTKWGSPRYDQLIRQAASAPAPSERVRLYNMAQKILLEEGVAILPLFHETHQYLVSSRVKKFRLDPVGGMYIKNFEM